MNLPLPVVTGQGHATKGGVPGGGFRRVVFGVFDLSGNFVEEPGELNLPLLVVAGQLHRHK